MTGYQKLQNALQKKPQTLPPIWMMRQAGRYHRAYQILRERYSFDELCKIPELAAETAMGPIRDFDFDLAILFSDLLFPLEGLGFGLSYGDGPPKLNWRLEWNKDFDRMRSTAEAGAFLSFQGSAVRATRALLPREKGLLGFVGGAWTLFGYATQGRHEGGLRESKQRLHLFSRFNEIMIEVLSSSIQHQLAGGADLVMIFDTAAGELSPLLFEQCVKPGIQELAIRFPKKLGYYARGVSGESIDAMAQIEPLAGVGLDHRLRLGSRLGQGSGFVQGNFDQNLLFLDTPDLKPQLRAFLDDVLKTAHPGLPGWICGLGHGVLPKTPERHVREFVDFTRQYLEEKNVV